MHTVLIVEADDHALRARGDELLLDGYDVVVAQTDRAARIRLGDSAVDVVVLGQLETPAAALAFLRELRGGEVRRADSRVPVLMIGTDSDQLAIRQYEAGADIVLPGNPSVLLIRAALTALRSRSEGERHRVLRIGPLSINCDSREVSVDGRPVQLSRLEFDLLRVLACKPNSAITRKELARELWNTDFVAGRTIDSHAVRLRSKLGEAGSMVHTVRGVGYRLGR